MHSALRIWLQIGSRQQVACVYCFGTSV